MKKILLSIVIFLLFASCGKDGADKTIVNTKQIENKTWVPDKTVYLMNGKASGEKEGLREGDIGGMQSLSFKNGYVTLSYGDEDEMFAYVIEDNCLKIISGYGPFLSYEIKTINDKELVLLSGATKKFERVQDDPMSQEHIVAKVNDTDIYVYLKYDEDSSNPYYYSFSRSFYYYKNGEPVRCALYSYDYEYDDDGHKYDCYKQTLDILSNKAIDELTERERDQLETIFGVALPDIPDMTDLNNYLRYHHWGQIYEEYEYYDGHLVSRPLVSEQELFELIDGFLDHVFGETYSGLVKQYVAGYGLTEEQAKLGFFYAFVVALSGDNYHIDNNTFYFSISESEDSAPITVTIDVFIEKIVNWLILSVQENNELSEAEAIVKLKELAVEFFSLKDNGDLYYECYSYLISLFSEQEIGKVSDYIQLDYLRDWRCYKYIIDYCIDLKEHFFYDGTYEWHLKAR